MRDYIREVAVPTVAYLIGVVFCVGIVVFCAGVYADLISNPIETAWEDAQ